MTVYKYLDLSTAHITQEEMEALSVGQDGDSGGLPRHIPHKYGTWMQVPWPFGQLPPTGFLGPDPEDGARAEEYPNVQRCIELARERECFWINFDQDADREEGLPTFDW